MRMRTEPWQLQSPAGGTEPRAGRGRGCPDVLEVVRWSAEPHELRAVGVVGRESVAGLRIP